MNRHEPTNCPSEEDLVLYVDEALDREASERIEVHAEGCARCAGTLRSLRALDEVLQAPEPAPAGLVERLLALPQEHARTRVAWRAPVAAVAGAAVVVLVALWLVDREPPRSLGPEADSPAQDIAATEPRPEEPTDFRSRVRTALLVPGPESRAFLEEVGDGALVVLHRITRGRDVAAARAAIERLGLLARRESLPVLCEVVGTEDRRGEAIRALGGLGDPRAVPVLEPLLADPDLRVPARDALVRIGGEEAALAIARRIERLADPEERACWIACLGRVDGVAGARALARLLEIPEASSAALAALRDNEDVLLPHLLESARRRDDVEAGRALAALECLAPRAAVPTLARLLGSRVRRAAAARVLARIDTPEAGRVLLEGLPAPDVRAAFRYAGGGIEDWLLTELARGDHRRRFLAIDLLGLCGGMRAVETLAALVDDPALAPQVVDALGRIGGEHATRVLDRLADRPALRRQVVAALGETRSKEAVSPLVRLGASARSLRVPVIRALGRIPCPEAVEAIVRLDRRSGTRSTTAHTLRAMDREVVVPVLTAMLEGDLAQEARRALDAVGRTRRRSPARRAVIQ